MTLNPAKDPSCVLAFDWGEGSGNIVYDLSNHGNHGFINGATRTRGILGYAGSFDGIDDYVVVYDSKDLWISEKITIIMWVYRFTDNRIDGNFNKGFSYYGFITATNLARWVIYDSAGNFSPLNSTTIITSGKWWCIARWFNGDLSVNNQRLYINGELDAKRTAAINEIRTNTAKLYIGATSPTLELFNGLIGSVRIYNRALSEKEIREHYYYGKKIFAQPEMFYHRKISPVLSTKATELARKVA